MLKIKIQKKIRLAEAEGKVVPTNNNPHFYLHASQTTGIISAEEIR